MATESSAIARLVEATQQQELPPLDGIFEPNQPQQAEERRPSQQPSPSPPRSGGNGWWLAVVAIVVIGGSVAGGYVLAERQKAENSKSGAVESAPATETASAEEHGKTSPSSLEAQVEPDPVAELGEQELALATQTGFDILVEPMGAKLTLDGHAIGVAPLRVRNLLPGAHRIDIEGPEGYFGQHREFDLTAGEAQVLRISLDRLDPETPLPVVGKTVVGKTGPKHGSPTREKVRKKERDETASSTSSATASEKKTLESADKVSLGTLMLGAKPPCDIIINGKKTGLSTPQRSIQLPEGTHRVVLVNTEHDIRKSFKVRIKPGRTTRAIQDLTKKL